MNKIIDAKFAESMDLDGIFEELGAECKISIERKEPEWCNGHIRSVYFDPKEPISLDWIKTKFGGEKLMVRLYGPKSAQNKSGYLHARTIDIMGPPRDGHGIELTQGPDGKAVKVTELSAAIKRHELKMGMEQKEVQQIQGVVPAPHSPDSNLFQVLIESQSSQHNSMLQMMGQRVQSLEDMLYRQNPAQVLPPQNPVEQIKQTMEVFTMMDKMKGKMSGDDGGELNSLLPMVGHIVKGMFSKNAATPQSSGNLMPPAKSPILTADGTSKRKRQKPVAPVETNNHDTISGMADKLSALTPDDAAEVVISAMGNMPDDRRAAAMESFFSTMNEMNDQTDELDESTTQNDNISQDEQQLTDPFSISETDPIPIQRGKSIPNETDDQTDRSCDKKGIAIPTDS